MNKHNYTVYPKIYFELEIWQPTTTTHAATHDKKTYNNGVVFHVNMTLLI